MNNFKKLTLLAAAAVFAASASAQTVYETSVDAPAPRTVPASQQATNSNWVNGSGEHAWMTNGSTRCVRSADWTSVTANKGCDGAIVEKAVVVPPPVDTRPIDAPIASEKVTYQEGVLFNFDNAKVKASEQVKLNELYAKIKGIDNLEVVVVTGYTDELGSAAYNMTLSKHRANAVKQYLVSKGVDSAHIYTEGKGKSNPVVSDCQEQVAQQPGSHVAKKQVRNNMIGCLAPNRRVEIQAVGTVHDAQPQVVNDAQPDGGVMQ